jgi:hypothetical protein
MAEENEGTPPLPGGPEPGIPQREAVETPLEKIEIIEQTLLSKEVLEFDPEILSLLDDPETSQSQIEDLKIKLGPALFNHLFDVANSAYHGSLKMGKVRHFYDVVNRLGMQHTKAAILMFEMHRLARGDVETTLVYVKSFAASVIGRMLARGLGFNDDAARKVELGCLFLNFGLLMMLVYRNRFQGESFHLDDPFIRTHQALLSQRIVNRFRLPGYLTEMIDTRCFSLDRMAVNLCGVVQMGIAAVEYSFRQFDDQFVVRADLPAAMDGSVTLGGILRDQFSAAGLRSYLKILPPLSRSGEGGLN